MSVTTPPVVPGFTVPTPTREDGDTFSARSDVYLAEQAPNATGVNSVAAWMNTTATQVETEALAVASALGLSNYKGVYAGGTTYGLGESVISVVGGDFWISNTAGNIGNALTPSIYWDKIDLTSVAVKTSGFDLDWAKEDILKFTAAADFAVTFSNIPTGGVALVEVVGGGDWTATYPAGVVFDNATAPTLATGTNTSVLQFYTSTGSAKVFCKSLFGVIA
tara:strand:- start:29089 stop:29751 length:663 start_codon:yes stop_codon:yes gene_type:complete